MKTVPSNSAHTFKTLLLAPLSIFLIIYGEIGVRIVWSWSNLSIKPCLSNEELFSIQLYKNMFASSVHFTISHNILGYIFLFSSSFRELDFLSGCSLLFCDECKFYISELLPGRGNGLQKLLCTPHWLSDREEGVRERVRGEEGEIKKEGKGKTKQFRNIWGKRRQWLTQR